MGTKHTESLIREGADGLYFRDGSVEFYLGPKAAPEKVNRQGVHDCLYHIVEARLGLINGYTKGKMPADARNRVKLMESAVETIAEIYMPFPKKADREGKTR